MKTASPLPKVDSARGAWLHLSDGRRVLDAISSWWVTTHGHCHPAIMQAIASQANSLDQVLFASFSHEGAERLAGELLELTHTFFHKVFFSDDGSTAVEVALKMALQAQAQAGQPGRTHFVAFDAAYHGDTVGAMSVAGASPFTAPFSPLLFPILRCRQGRHRQDPLELWTSHFVETMARHGEQVAAVILEPLVQGAGGMIVWPEDAVRHIVEVARSFGAYVIFDEVMTGFGRTGALFAFQKLGLTPDLLCLSKGLTAGALPLAVTLCSKVIYDSFWHDDRARMFFHGHSFTANPMGCAAALANLELLRQGGLQAKWNSMEAIHRRQLEGLADHPAVADGRFCGTIAAVELKTKQVGYLSGDPLLLHRQALEKGVLLRPLGNVLYLLPPYCITEDELLRCWKVLADLLP
jgi:adenosylmethionine-8-amino-7-oxononanoate aminotransferase